MLKLGKPVQKEALRRDIVRRAGRLPSPPVIVLKLMRLVDDDAIGARHFEQYFRSDQALTARLLKLVNSSFFGVREQVSTIPQAIQMVGFKTLRSILLSLFFNRLLPKALLAYGYGPKGLWQHSLGVATLARELAIAMALPKKVAEEVYVAGLMHDVGKIVLGGAAQEPLSLVPDVEDEENLSDGLSNITSVEQRATGFDHVNVGKMVLERWKLPPDIVQTVQGHHNRNITGRKIGVVHLADQVCVGMRLGYVSSCNYDGHLCRGIFETVGLESSEVKAVVDKSKKKIIRASKMFTS